MRTTRLGHSPADIIPDWLRATLHRRLAEMAGFALIALAIALAVAFASWSVKDPSLSHAAEGGVRNLLGRPGAIAADLAMQIFGIASIAFLIVIAAFGGALLAHRRVRDLGLRIAFTVLAIVASAGFASLLPGTERWPLPTGLGGVAGDVVLSVPRLVFSGLSGVAGIVCAVVLGMVAIVSLSIVAGGVSREAEDEEEIALAYPAARGRDDDEPSAAIVSIGAVIHWFLSLRGMVRRWRARRAGLAPVAAPAPARGANLPDHAPMVLNRREPRFETDMVRARAAGPSPDSRPPLQSDAPFLPEQDDDDEEADDFRSTPATTLEEASSIDEPAPIRAPAADRAPRAPAPSPAPARGERADDEPQSPRVALSGAAIRQGHRAAREAQSSMFETGEYQFPPLAILAEPKRSQAPLVSADALEQNARLLEGVLDDFGVRGEIINVRPGPVVTLYELEPAPGTKSSRVIGLAEDIARSMSAVAARVAVVPGRNAIGIELPNAKRETVYLRELLASEDFEKSKFRLPICLGKTIGGEPVIVELARMPHLLVAGTTGSGKSVAINTMICSLLYRLKPEECRLIMVDPKMLELSIYDGIPHLLTPVVTDPKKAVVALKWAVREMEDRYRKMSKLGVRNIDGYNARVKDALAKGEALTRTVQTGFDDETGEAIYEDEVMADAPLPFIVVIVDEMADLMLVAGKDIEGAIQRLAQMARAAGIHLIMATQRPSVDVITGTIKANFPTRISFQVTSKIDSRTILGEQGAEQLLGQGDMLYMAGGGRIGRVHGPFVADEEVEKIVAHLKTQGRPDYVDAVTADLDGESGGDEDGAVFDKGSFGDESADLYDQAIAVVLRDKKASTSYIQRRLQIGYNRAASLIERMEREGIVGPANHAGKREILLEPGTET